MRNAHFLAWLSCAFLGCANDFSPPSLVDTLRVLAVRPEPASGAPGQTSTLTMVVADGASTRTGSVAPRPLQIAWLAGCHNPPSRQFFGCYPELTALAAELSPRVVETPETRVPRAWFGTGESFSLEVPPDILSGAPRAVGDAIHFGVSYAFFAVCAGELRPRSDVTDRLPLDCVEPSTGTALGRSDFVTGVSTLFSYEGVTNHNPVLESVHFGPAVLTSLPCQSDSDCAATLPSGAPGFDLVCGSLGTCLPSLPACSRNACPKFLISPQVEPTSAEPLPGQNANETVWASFYATAGSFDSATELVNDQGAGYIADHGSYFSVPADRTGSTELWVTVNDQRGGVAVQAFELLLH
jgi:hypothetical protein